MKKQLKTKLTITKLCLLTGIISSIIISIIYTLNNVSPFGDQSLLDVDFYHQYGPMLGELYDRVHNFSSLIYSFNMGMGLPIFRNFLNYLSSPFNIIMFFFKREHLLTAFSVIIGLKPVASSITLVYYLSKKYHKVNLSLIPFGIIYGFSAYFSAYHWNLMWLDGMVFLPLVTLGIENIIDNNKWKLYTICLAITLLANYYIGYMVCIFSVLYFIVYSISKLSFKKDELKKSLKKLINNCFKFAGSSILAGGIIAILIIPLYFSLRSISATGEGIPLSQYYLFEVVEFLKYHFSGVTNTVFASDTINAPNISCGILSLTLLLCFLLNVELPIKQKLPYIALLLFFVIAFFYAPLDFILQGFHVPNDLPYRYSFIYSFALIITSYYSFINLKKMNYRISVIVYLILAISLFVMSGEIWPGITINTIYRNVIILSILFVLYTIFKTRNVNQNIIYIIIIILVSYDTVLSIDNNWDINHEIAGFYEEYDYITTNISNIKDNDSELFYRLERENSMTLNDTSWYGYPGITSFSSMNYESVAKLQHHLGIAGNVINSYIYHMQTPIYDLMYDVKYFLGYSQDNKRYSRKYNDDSVNQFNYNVGLAYGVNKKLLSWDTKNNNPFAIQNEYIEKATDISDVLIPVTIKNKEIISDNGKTIIIKYTYNNPNDNLYFYTNNYDISFVIFNNTAYYKNNGDGKIPANLNDLYYGMDDYNETRIINFISDDNEIVIYAGYEQHTINYRNEILLYTIDNEKFISAVNKLKNNKLNITSFKETKIIGNINLDNNMIVYTSIPYDEGWHVLVDNKKVKTHALANSLLTFEAGPGEHKVVIYYQIKGFYLGLIISIISLGILIYNKKILAFVKKNIIIKKSS